jgi:hypothetical protein
MSFSDLSFLSDIAHYIHSWWGIAKSYGMAGMGVVACAAAAWFVPSLKVKVIAIFVAGLIVSNTIAFSVGQHQGAARVHADWDWSMEIEARDGEKDRSDAIRDLHDRPHDSGVRDHDRWNRDSWEKPAGEGGEVRRPEAH